LNWKDRRDINKNKSNAKKFSSFGWSHGSPGIGLCRHELSNSEIYDTNFNQNLLVDLKKCTDSVYKFGISEFNSDSVIFGNFGNLEVFLLEKVNHRKLITDSILNLSQNRKFPFGNFGIKKSEIILPGFWTGSSGMGYQFLRLAFNDIPNILSFETQ
jgi:lantibiotic modifying enzyme